MNIARTHEISRPDQWGLKSPFAALHHVALVTDDMEKTVAFYRDILGSEIALGHRMPRDGKERHYFITVAPNTVFAFFEFPDAKTPPYQPPTEPKTGRALDHIALRVEDHAALEAWRERLLGKADNVSEIRELPGGFTRAFFFSDPNGIVIELMVLSEDAPFPMLEDPDPAY